jgi:SulP family sulfate permease
LENLNPDSSKQKQGVFKKMQRNFFVLRFRPRLLDSLQGYSSYRFSKDLAAGATVAVVALPLAMAFAIASGLPPQAGIFTAIIAGFLISALGGSTVQIGGPAGAYIVIVYGIVERYGVANLIIATAMSGMLLFAMGALKLGGLIRFIPIAVVIGFTNGIAVLIGVSQIKDFLGLAVANVPADFFAKIQTIAKYLPTTNFYAVGLGCGGLGLIFFWQKLMPRVAPKMQFTGKLTAIPGTIVALVVLTILVAVLQLPVETIGSRFGGIPQALPAFTLPDFSWATAKLLFIPTITIALLGAIESLLCARVADGMMDVAKHDPNQELMAQGVANIITPFFGGMPATGTMARTVTNIKSGATSPIAGMLHAVILLLIIVIAAPLANSIPLAVLASILMFGAWNMGEWREFTRLRHFKLTYRMILIGTFLLTVIFDLTMAVEVGLVIACGTFIYRISSLTHVTVATEIDYPVLEGKSGEIAAYRLYGALFFGTVNRIEQLSENLPSQALVLDFKNLLYMDSSGLDTMRMLLSGCKKTGVRLVVCGLSGQPLEMVKCGGLLASLGVENVAPTFESGLAKV